MGHYFEDHERARLDTSPERVWDAIATGPGIDSWFMGRNEVEPGENGTVRMAFGGYTPEHRITGWEPGKRLAYRSDTAPDGRFVAYEFLIEAREQGSTVMRIVTSGFLPGDDWEDEYEAMTRGGQLFFQTLVEYLSHFAGRAATPVTAFGPMVQDWGRTRAALYSELGLSEPVIAGTPVRFTGPASTPVEGVVYVVNPDAIGIRSDDGMYRFMRGFHGPLIAGHHLFSDTDPGEAERGWQDWLAGIAP